MIRTWSLAAAVLVMIAAIVLYITSGSTPLVERVGTQDSHETHASAGHASSAVARNAPAEPIRHDDAPEATAPSTRADTHEPTSLERARSWLLLHRKPSGDLGVDHWIVQTEILLGDPHRLEPRLGTPEQLQSNRVLNPLGTVLTAEENRQLESLIAEYRSRLGDCELSRQLELYMANAAAAQRGDSEPIPCLTEARPITDRPSAPVIDEQTMASYARIRERHGADAVLTSMPGMIASPVGRLVGLNRDNAPEFWAAHERLLLERSELDLAIRTFFQHLSRRR